MAELILRIRLFRAFKTGTIRRIFRSFALIHRTIRLAAVLILALTASLSFAQGIQLSAEQQQMLNQLPPAQRQQAMDAIRQLQAQQTPSAQQSINEPVSQATFAGIG